jgi:hypothetical protein
LRRRKLGIDFFVVEGFTKELRSRENKKKDIAVQRFEGPI